MSDLKLGHRLARELSQRGDRRKYFWPAEYRELRGIDSVEEIADFFDRTRRYRYVRASEDVDEMANEIAVENNAPGIEDPVKMAVIVPFLGVLILPFLILWRLIGRLLGGEQKS